MSEKSPIHPLGSPAAPASRDAPGEFTRLNSRRHGVMGPVRRFWIDSRLSSVATLCFFGGAEKMGHAKLRGKAVTLRVPEKTTKNLEPQRGFAALSRNQLGLNGA